MNQHRQPPGIPTGGQFAAGSQLRPAFRLTEDGRVGLDPTVAAPYLALGFDPDTAADWHEAGFEADDAVTWRDLHGRHLSPMAAAEFANNHVSASDALDYTAYGVHDPRTVAEFIEARIPGPDAAEWQTTLRGLGVEDGYIGNAAAEWHRNGFSLAEARSWSSTGQLHPDHAGTWRQHGFAPEEASTWERALFDAREAADWRAEGFTPDRADYWATRGFDPASARREGAPGESHTA